MEATPLTNAAALTRSGRQRAQAAAWGPPPDTPSTAKCPTQRWSASWATSFAHPSSVRRRCRVLDPYPGRSGAVTRAPAACAELMRTWWQEPEVPWNAETVRVTHRAAHLCPGQLASVGQLH
jgi:hypothetical protein